MRKILLIAVALGVFAVSVTAQKPSPSPVEAPFLMEIEDFFSISGVGTIVTGKVERGKIKVGDSVELIGFKPSKTWTVARIDAFGRPLQEAAAGDKIGVVLRGIDKVDLVRGQLIVKPGSVKTYGRFQATIDMTEAKDGGRRTPIASGFRPQVFFRTVAFSGTLTLTGGRQDAAAGEKAIPVEIKMIEPTAIEIGSNFSLREGGRTVAIGTVTQLIAPK